MTRYDIICRQARCAALGFWPGPIDGRDGPRTRAAYAEAQKAQERRGLPFQHASGLTRLHLHWTAGAAKASALDQKHYHVVIQGDGSVLRPHAPTERLAHTLNANGGAIALSLCGMAGAVERPFTRGSAPITAGQLVALAREAAALCAAYDIPVSPWSVLMHSEVQGTLGIKQRGKWDLDWLPQMKAPGTPREAGDILRRMIAAGL